MSLLTHELGSWRNRLARSTPNPSCCRWNGRRCRWSWATSGLASSWRRQPTPMPGTMRWVGCLHMAWEHWPVPEHVESIYSSGLVWFRDVLWFAVVCPRMCIVTLFFGVKLNWKVHSRNKPGVLHLLMDTVFRAGLQWMWNAFTVFAFTAGVGVELPAPAHLQNCSAGPLSVPCTNLLMCTGVWAWSLVRFTDWWSDHCILLA